jgi:predicted N-formylglutamate amidohydrolase
VDCNRVPYTFAWIPPESDGVLVPGNQNISQDEMDFRMQLYFEPYHREIARRLDAFADAGKVPLVISIHSFTPRMMDGADRPWHVAILSNDDRRIADPLLLNLRRQTDYLIGDNEPYSGTSPLGYSLKAYNMERGLPFAMFEIRQDLVADPAGTRHWAEVVAEAMRPILADETLRTIRRSSGQCAKDQA